MDLWQIFIEWASDATTTNATRTFAALLAIPGSLWGAYLFWRWVSGRSIAAQVEKLLSENAAILGEVAILATQIAVYNRYLQQLGIGLESAEIDKLLKQVNTSKDLVNKSLGDIKFTNAKAKNLVGAIRTAQTELRQVKFEFGPKVSGSMRPKAGIVLAESPTELPNEQSDKARRKQLQSRQRVSEILKKVAAAV